MKPELLRTYKVNGKAFGVYRCPRCGGEFGARRDHVNAGNVKSCGCLRRSLFVRDLQQIDAESSDGRSA